MATDKNDTKTIDIDWNAVDRAIRAVRDYQKGQATTSFVRATLSKVPASELPLVSVATRLSMAQLQALYSPGG